METMQTGPALKTKIQNWISAKKHMPTVPGSVPEHKGARKLIDWVDGVPTPVTSRTLTPESVQEVAACAMALEYSDEDDPNEIYPELYGLTYLEVAFIKTAQKAATGDLSALDTILDRTIGKPKQSIEKKTLSMTYQDFLASISDASADPLSSMQVASFCEDDSQSTSPQEEVVDLDI